MLLLLTSLSLLFTVQAPAIEIRGEVVDSRGNSVAGASVLIDLDYAGHVDAVSLDGTSDADGHFLLVEPAPLGTGPRGTVSGNSTHLFAYRPGAAVAVGLLMSPGHRLVLREAEPRTVTLEHADGKPLGGVKVMPRLLNVLSVGLAGVPPRLAGRIAATTGPDGKATLTCLTARDEVVAVRISGDTIATQDLVLEKRTGTATRIGPATIRIKGIGRMSGRIVDERGQGVVGQAVEIWTRGGGNGRLYPYSVEFAGGPVRTGADGSFQTPASLLQGSMYRFVIRSLGHDLVLGDWVFPVRAPAGLPISWPAREIGGARGQPRAHTTLRTTRVSDEAFAVSDHAG